MEVARYGIIKVKPFDKEKIEEIIKVNLGIKNSIILKEYLKYQTETPA